MSGTCKLSSFKLLMCSSWFFADLITTEIAVVYDIFLSVYRLDSWLPSSVQSVITVSKLWYRAVSAEVWLGRFGINWPYFTNVVVHVPSMLCGLRERDEGWHKHGIGIYHWVYGLPFISIVYPCVVFFLVLQFSFVMGHIIRSEP